MTTITELRELEEALDALDFSKRGAHKTYSALAEETSKLVTNIRFVSDKEFRFFALGHSLGMAEQKFLTIPPPSVVTDKSVAPETMTTKRENE